MKTIFREDHLVFFQHFRIQMEDQLMELNTKETTFEKIDKNLVDK